MQRLRGGLGTRMHSLAIQQANGSRLKVVLRRYFVGEHPYLSPEHAGYEFRLLVLAKEAGIVAPLPLLLDSSGEFLLASRLDRLLSRE